MKFFELLAAACLAMEFPMAAATVKDREAAVRNDRANLESEARWIYNDFDRGFAEAKRTGKPLLITLRCVPCLACAGIDAAVLLQQTELAPLLDEFVCVRVIDANVLDLNRFEFDYDLSFSTLFFNGDGTVYGRYGSWRHQKDPQDKTTAGFKRALEAALALHKQYPTNKAALAGKQPHSCAFKRPVDIPLLAARYKPELDWEGEVVRSCIHCHQIGEALRMELRQKSQPLPIELIYPWPAPETIGLTLAPDEAAHVESVVPGSPAAGAGLRAGDDLVSIDGQPLVSIADLSWVLHHAPQTGNLPLNVKRKDAQKQLSLKLPAGWREKTDISRRVGTWSMRRMATGGMVLEDLADDARTQRGLSRDKMALKVTFVSQNANGGTGKNAGFKKDDVLVELDGQTERLTESQIIGRLLLKHKPGAQVHATVLREKDRIELSLPLQ